MLPPQRGRVVHPTSAASTPSRSRGIRRTAAIVAAGAATYATEAEKASWPAANAAAAAIGNLEAVRSKRVRSVACPQEQQAAARGTHLREVDFRFFC